MSLYLEIVRKVKEGVIVEVPNNKMYPSHGSYWKCGSCGKKLTLHTKVTHRLAFSGAIRWGWGTDNPHDVLACEGCREAKAAAPS